MVGSDRSYGGNRRAPVPRSDGAGEDAAGGGAARTSLPPRVSLRERRLWCSVRAADGSLRRNVGRVNRYRICICAFAAQTPRLAKPGRRGDGRAAVSDLVESLAELRHDSGSQARSGRQSGPHADVAPAGQPHGRGDTRPVELRLERVDRAAGGAVVDPRTSESGRLRRPTGPVTVGLVASYSKPGPIARVPSRVPSGTPARSRGGEPLSSVRGKLPGTPANS